MKTTVLAASAIAAVLGTAALSMTADELAAQLLAEGYTKVEVEDEGSVISVEGYKDGLEREIVLSASDGSVLSDMTSQEDVGDDDVSEDDDDDEDEDEQDEDEDEDDHDDEDDDDDNDDDDEDDDDEGDDD